MRYYVDFIGTAFDAKERRLYADAASFLRDKENAATIITSAEKESFGVVIKEALEGIPRMSVIYTEGTKKGEFLAPHPHLHADALLVDDSPAELEVLAHTCPDLALYEMRRDGGVGDGRWPVLRSLSELP
ncbi:MAG TPA: hypothetical protein PK609_01830 [Candidatus Paceibacterota bacterium]|nr:hypothetical protein [Candidatus Paceibacterota bacterium]